MFGLTLEELLGGCGAWTLLNILGLGPGFSVVLILGSILLLRSFRKKAEKVIHRLFYNEARAIKGKKENRMFFPVVEQHENELVNIEGKSSWIFEVTPPDLEQLLPDQQAQFFVALRDSLNRLDENVWVKVKRVGEKIYLNTNKKDFHLPNFSLNKIEEPFGVNLATSDLYSEIMIESDRITFNGTHKRLLYVKDLPVDISENYLECLGDYFLILKPVNRKMAKASLDKKRNQLFAGKTNRPTNYNEEFSAQDLEDFRASLEDNVEMLWKLEAWALVEANDGDSLNQLTESVVKNAERFNVDVRVEDVRLKKAYIETLFGVEPRLNVRPLESGAKTSVVSCLLPTHEHRLMQDGFLTYARDWTPLKYDLTSPHFLNSHLAVAGMTGAGKSVFTQYVCNHYIERGSNAIIVDRGRSYEKLCLWHGGVYLEGKINFLEFNNPDYLTEVIISLMADDGVSRNAQGEIYGIVKEAINANATQTHREFFSFLVKKKPELRNYLTKFQEMVTDDRVDGSNKVIFCEMTDIDEQFQTAVFLYLFEKFRSIKDQHTIIVFEEIHTLLNTNGERIARYFRETRKHNGTCISITQSVNDCEIYPLAKVIWENSEHKAIFHHESTIQEEFLREIQKKQINDAFKESRDGELNKSLVSQKRDFAKLILSNTSFSKEVLLKISPLYYNMFNTTPRDLKNFREWVLQNESLFMLENGKTDYKKMIQSYTAVMA